MRLSNEPMHCIWVSGYCLEDKCPYYHYQTQQCKIVMAVNRFLGDFDTYKSPTEIIIDKILREKPNLTKEAVERLIDEERAKAAGLLTEEASAHLVASKLGLGQETPDSPKRTERHPLIPKKSKPFPKLEPRKYLQEITGEVVDAPEIKEVNTRSGPKQIANFNFTDGKSTIRVGIWEELFDEMGDLKAGDVIILKGMSIRDPYQGVEQISSTRNTKIA